MKYGMDETKIQVNFLKALINKRQVIFCEGLEGKTGLSDGCACFFIPDERMFLDRKDRKPFSIEWHISTFINAWEVHKTEFERTTKEGINVVEFENEQTKIWVDKKYLQYFGSDVRYYATLPKMPLYVTNEDQELLAFILPVNP